MFDIGWGEFVVIGIVALIAIGPKELPGVLRTAGQWMGKLKRMANEFQGQFHEALREAEMTDLKKHADDLKSAVGDIANYNPSTYKPSESTPEYTATADLANDAPPNDLLTPPLPDITVPLPADIPPVSEKDFASAPAKPAADTEESASAQKPAGGTA